MVVDQSVVPILVVDDIVVQDLNGILDDVVVDDDENWYVDVIHGYWTD